MARHCVSRGFLLIGVLLRGALAATCCFTTKEQKGLGIHEKRALLPPKGARSALGAGTVVRRRRLWLRRCFAAVAVAACVPGSVVGEWSVERAGGAACTHVLHTSRRATACAQYSRSRSRARAGRTHPPWPVRKSEDGTPSGRGRRSSGRRRGGEEQGAGGWTEEETEKAEKTKSRRRTRRIRRRRRKRRRKTTTRARSADGPTMSAWQQGASAPRAPTGEGPRRWAVEQREEAPPGETREELFMRTPGARDRTLSRVIVDAASDVVTAVCRRGCRRRHHR